ncbi:hypothetical protein KO516_21525 [Citreicella sp. C3M06]|uniref:hypothetical protein n=1 Tax=Citreicella sp. C3M06 TaxID=2841564 RepID=UPI001C09B81B|nr:hypothetical protein [Citreicella sp. C3M06]MBU2963357.1 hypothetical protein [Citreicella sp. C3M06]
MPCHETWPACSTHGPASEHEDLALWYACEVMEDADLYDSEVIASACELVLDHAQATYADRQLATHLLANTNRNAA